VLRPGGLLVAMEYDLENARSIPRIPLLADALGWISRAFVAVGQPQTLGPRLGHLLHAAGFEDPQVAGAQSYLAPDDPAGPALVSGVVRSLLPVIAAHGIATPDEVDVDTLGARVGAELARHDAALCPPTLVGGWAYA
jgi:hypothetical protein